MLAQDSLMRILGSLIVLIGGSVLIVGHEANGTIEGVMRLIAWATALKGILYCWFPKTFQPLHRWLFSAKHIHSLWGLLACAAGVFFLWTGKALSLEVQWNMIAGVV